MHLKTSLALALFALLLARVQAGILSTPQQSDLSTWEATSPASHQSNSSTWPDSSTAAPLASTTSHQSNSSTWEATSPASHQSNSSTWPDSSTAVPLASTTSAPSPICHNYGLYVGDSLDVRTDVPSEKACLADCQLLPGCNFYSFEENFCNLLMTAEYIIPCMDPPCYHGSKDCEACNFVGKCQGGTQTANHTLPDEYQCNKLCSETPECEWFSFETSLGQDHGSCQLFQNCQQFTLPDYAVGDSHITITSGASSCVPLTCFVPGECHGHMYQEEKTEDEQKCLEQCVRQSCSWFTYYKEAGVCALFDEECTLFDADGCEDCVTGQRECYD